MNFQQQYSAGLVFYIFGKNPCISFTPHRAEKAFYPNSKLSEAH